MYAKKALSKSGVRCSCPVPSRSLLAKGHPSPVVPNIVQQTNASFAKKPRTFEEIFDDLMVSAKHDTPYQAIEIDLQPVLDATHVVLWVYLEEHNSLFSPSFGIFGPINDCLLAAGYKSRCPFVCEAQRTHILFNPQIDGRIIPPTQPLLMVPIRAKDGHCFGVIQFSRKPDKLFGEQDLAIASFLMKKFEIYARFLFLDMQEILTAAELTRFGGLCDVVTTVLVSLERIFRCRKAEIWKFKRGATRTWRYEKGETIKQAVELSRAGVVGYSLSQRKMVNERSVLRHPNHDDFADGFYDEAILVYPYLDEEEKVWAIALRGREQPPSFSESEEIVLRAVAPFVIRSVAKAIKARTVDENLDTYQSRLTALLEVAEALSGVLDIEELIPLIMDRSCNLLDAERCSLFLVDPVKQQLVTRFAGGLSKTIRIPIGKGIVGTVATTGEIINIPDAYNDERFDRSIDKKTGFRTKAILALPIFNNRGEIAGVTEMINRKDGGSFNDDDIRLMMGFNVFCGISLDNAKLYSASLDLAKQLRTFVDMSEGFMQKDSIRASIEKILDNARDIIYAKRASLYLCEAENDLTLLVSVGESSSYGDIFAKEVVQKGQMAIYAGQELKEKAQLGQSLDSAIEKMLAGEVSLRDLTSETKRLGDTNSTTRSSRVMKVLMSEGDDAANDIQESVCALPLFNSDGKVLGVMELECQRIILSEDVKLLDSMAIFAAVTIERNQLQDIATLGEQEQELQLNITPLERTKCDVVPARLALTPEETAHIQSINFDSPQWDGIGHLKVCFGVFHRFGLQEKFKISNEKLFRFLTEIRDTYNPVPYHNWRHAVDVTEFVTYQVTTGNLDKELTSFELFALVVAAICHDANHDGFTNVYNVKAETPLGILFKNQSVMETHHCAVAISILSKEQCNLFATLEPDEYKKMWTTIIQLILATDMAKHFEILKTFNALKDNNEFSLENNEHRVMLMQLVLKSGDISNVSRPFELADKWCDVLCEEFFRQGDLESASGMEYTSPLNDRAHLDKPKSQIGFYTFVCLPLFEATARAVPELMVNVEQVKSNLAVWKAASEKAQAEQK